MSKEAMQMALDALESTGLRWPRIEQAIEALRTALAQPEPEPAAWLNKLKNGTWLADVLKFEGEEESIPLYFALPQRKPLTDEHIFAIVVNARVGEHGIGHTIARAIEAAHGIKEAA